MEICLTLASVVWLHYYPCKIWIMSVFSGNMTTLYINQSAMLPSMHPCCTACMLVKCLLTLKYKVMHQYVCCLQSNTQWRRTNMFWYLLSRIENEKNEKDASQPTACDPVTGLVWLSVRAAGHFWSFEGSAFIKFYLLICIYAWKTKLKKQTSLEVIVRTMDEI